MNTYYIGDETYRIDTDPPSNRLWSEFMDAITALDAYQEYVMEFRSILNERDDDITELREKIEELEAKLAEASER